MVGQTGVGKSHLLEALGRRYCELGYRVRYTTSAELLDDLRKSLADQTLSRRIGYGRWSISSVVERVSRPTVRELFQDSLEVGSIGRDSFVTPVGGLRKHCRHGIWHELLRFLVECRFPEDSPP